MNPAKSSNPSKTDADRVNPGTPGQGKRPEAPPETQDQAGGRAQSRAEDELDEGKRLRPKFNTNLDRLRRTGGKISQEKAPDSVRVESGTRAPDSTRAESGPISAGTAPDSVADFAGSDPYFSSDSD